MARVYVLAVLVAIATVAMAQVPIPSRKTGFRYRSSPSEPAVEIGFYIGPMCPDSKQAFPTLTAVAEAYSPQQVALVTHLFPLPYHRNAFLAAKGAHIVANMTPGQGVYKWLQMVYDDLDAFSNTATHDMSEAKVQSQFSAIAEKMSLSPSKFLSMYKNDQLEEDTRVGWKYTATRGVAWTPAFMVNDVLVQADASWSVTQWKQLLDSVLQPSKTPLPQFEYQLRSNTTCKIGTKRCEYLPGKVECCTPGEGCIPNVGCRC